MRRSNRKIRRRKPPRRRRGAKSAALAAMGLVSLSLAGMAAASERAFFIFDKETSRMPGLRLAQVKRSGARRGARGLRGMRGVGPGGIRAAPGVKKRMGVSRGGYLRAAPGTGGIPALDGGSKDTARKRK